MTNCTLKALCKTCEKKHLIILHDVNDREKDKEAVVTTTEKTYLVMTTSEVFCVDRPVQS